jgi:hypothetical protein
MRNRPGLVAFVFVGLVLGGCGGADRNRPSDEAVRGEDLDPCGGADGYELQTLTNFEPRPQGDRLNRLVICDAATPCMPYFNHDEANTPPNPSLGIPRGLDCVELAVPDAIFTADPLPPTSSVNSTEIPGGRCEEPGSALHVAATNLGMCYGSDSRLGWGAGFDLTFSPVLDASQWDGIALWVKNGAPTSQALIVTVVDAYTNGAPLPDTGIPGCNAMDPPPGEPPVPDAEKCDAFGMVATLTQPWTFIPVRFSEMQQKGFGVPSPFGRVDSSQVVRIQFLITAGDWNFWIDDISLFRAPE